MKLKIVLLSAASLLLTSVTAIAEVIGGGGENSGCVMGPSSGFDPMFPLLLLLAGVYLLRRRLTTRTK